MAIGHNRFGRIRFGESLFHMGVPGTNLITRVYTTAFYIMRSYTTQFYKMIGYTRGG